MYGSFFCFIFEIYYILYISLSGLVYGQASEKAYGWKIRETKEEQGQKGC